MASFEEVEEIKNQLLTALDELDLESRHEKHALNEIIDELEEGLHRFEEKELEDHPSGRNQG